MPNYRQLHEQSLAQNRPKFYRQLKRSGELKQYLDDIAQEAKELHERIVQGLREKQPYNPVKLQVSREAWEAHLERVAEEIVLHDLILVPDEETERAMRDGYVD